VARLWDVGSILLWQGSMVLNCWCESSAASFVLL
jgi:hypothetical protein